MLQTDQILHDRYQLKQVLGQTAGRQTWLANDISVQPVESVVVKLLLFGDQVQWDDLKLFEREAQVLRQLNHPQIPKYRDFFSIDDRLLWFGLVQEYIPGQSLKTLLTEGKRFSEKQVRQIATNLLHLLMYLHELSPSVLHRDIKPSNLILGEDHFIYLVDFGAVQDRAAIEGATFTVVGTYGYAPMEQFGGRAVPASDLYALGATLIHLLTGVSPAELPQKDLCIQFRDRISLEPSFVRWIEILVDPDVNKRFQSAREALETLRDPTVLTAKMPLPVWRSHSMGEFSPSVPGKTAIVVEVTNDALQITLPSRGLIAVTLLLVLGGMGLIFLNLLVGSVWPILIFSVLGFFLWQDRLVAQVRFDSDRFVIYKEIFGHRLAMGTGITADIRNVFHTVKTIQSGKSSQQDRYVVVQTSRGEDVFGRGLSWEEGDWLVTVIQEWLHHHR